MGRWLDLANSMETKKGVGDDRDNGDKRAAGQANGSTVPIVPARSARDRRDEWERGVASLDPDKPLGGYDPDRWKRIVRDCDNLVADFGLSASALGWSSIDLFGFDAQGSAGANLGGLVWRLDGGRAIAMDENCATYRAAFSDRTSRFSKGYLERLALSFVPVWELQS